MSVELVIYPSDDGLAQVQFRPMEGSLWLTQLQLAKKSVTRTKGVPP